MSEIGPVRAPRPYLGEVPTRPDPGDWWSEGRFTGRFKWLCDIQNELFDNSCREFDKVISAHQSSVSAKELHAIRADVIIATRWSSIRDGVTECAAAVVNWTYANGSFGFIGIVVLLWLSQSPDWLRELALFATVLYAVPERYWPKIWLSDIITFATLILIPVNLVVPANGWQWLWRLLAGVLTLVVALLLATVTDHILDRYKNRRYLALFACTVTASIFLLGARAVARGLEPHFPLPKQLLIGLELGVVAGAVIALWFVLVETVNQIEYRIVEAKKLRANPEEEFVQSTIWAMSALDAPALEEKWIDSTDQRRIVAWRLRWLSQVLERDIPRSLARYDRRNSELLAQDFAMRAAVLRAWARNLIVGDRKTGSTILDQLWNAAIIGASRRWSLLPKTKPAESIRVSIWARAWNFGRKLVLVVVVLALLVAAIITDQNERVVTTVAIVFCIVLINFILPGGGEKVAKMASQGLDISDAWKRPVEAGARITDQAKQSDGPSGSS